jgi:uncharacterized protein with HEPN domain
VTEDKDERRLRAIHSDIERIQRTLKAHGDDAFLENADVQDAIIMRLYRISDLTSRLSDALRGRQAPRPLLGEILEITVQGSESGARG